MRAQKKRAGIVYGIFALWTLALVVWVALDFTITAQFVFIFAELGGGIVLWILYRRFSLKGVFSTLHEGVIVGKEAKTHLKTPPGALPWGRFVPTRVAFLAVETDGIVRQLPLKSIDLYGIFEVGDRILYAHSLAAPAFLDPGKELYVCPWCGAIFPPSHAKACAICSLPIVHEEHEKNG
ncbi:MAG: hypothetical protein IJ009_05060 [Clostridia bacterium]|nr:hypothetical protein [Clostridia bacterium]